MLLQLLHPLSKNPSINPRSAARLLRGADGAGAHADAQRVRAGLRERARLAPGHHVARDDLQARVRALEVRQHLQLVRRVACARVKRLLLGLSSVIHANARA